MVLDNLTTRCVLEVDPFSITEPKEYKAVLAMQATALNGTPDFDQANSLLIDVSSQMGVAPTMTYEDLIFANPFHAGTYVVSSDSQVGQQESLFYLKHYRIEACLASAISQLLSRDFDEAAASIQRATRNFGALFRQLKPEAFNSFRPHFSGLNGYPGPSGLFTAAVPILDLLTHGGSNIDEIERSRMLTDVRRGLYPSHQSGYLGSLLQSNKPNLPLSTDQTHMFADHLNRFRNMHTSSVDKFVPGARSAGAAGSGGIEDVTTYLASKYIRLEGEQND